MSELALYRKYRPQSFREVIGQDHVVRALEGAIREGNVAHAYLFAGSRGTGKTSVARIFARALGTTEKDLYEIDAASHTGVDDVRELREGAAVLPFESPLKVYIIDEAHMLSKSAFNALLKTLEEPPKHVLFVLATTELEKLPETIVSRCQTFVFKKPPREALKDMVSRVAKAEGFALEPASADLIALIADGSFRDAHGILQKILAASSDKKVSVEEVELVAGAPRGKLVNDFLAALDAGKLEEALQAVAAAAGENVEMKVFLKLVLEKCRAVLLHRFAPKLADKMAERFPAEDAAFLKKLAANKGTRLNAAALAELLKAYNATGRTAVPELPLELALVRLLGKDE